MQLKYLYQTIYSLHDPIHVERFQKTFGLEIIHDQQNDEPRTNHLSSISSSLSKKYRIRNYLWYYLFSFGARLGYEVFYALSFSYLYWNLDSFICRQLMLIWAILMYTGQALKDVIRIPRPNGPNIVILEPEYSFEYGMPSTHAMLAAMIPLTLYSLLSNRYQISSSPLLFIFCSICWCSLICCSRLYLGMHSVLDILVGLSLTCILLAFILPMLSVLDYFLIRNSLSPLIIIVVLLISSLLYPVSNKQSPSRGDTISIISASGGVYIGSWLNYQLSIIRDSSHLNELYPILLPSLYDIPVIVGRFAIGLCSLFILRSLGKSFAQHAIRYFTGLKDLNNEQTKHRTIVEIPMKMIPFIMVGLAISFFGPLMARLTCMERHSMRFEA
ncbi:sphingosine-1-phosphate phosphohydrolase-like protein [Dermatophagoides farinae]|nr:sphingosine-1-phosphate phosphohydrolase-like protein [Dermatophagoides farinae]